MSKNRCPLSILCALQMGGWQRKYPPEQGWWCLRSTGRHQCELLSASNPCCPNFHHFLKSPNLITGLPLISTGAGSHFLRVTESCSAPPLWSERIHTWALSFLFTAHCTKPQGSFFWVSVLCSCSQILVRSTEGTDSRLSKCFQIPLILHAVKICRGFAPQPSLLLQGCSPGIWGCINHTHLSLFLFKHKQHVKKTVSLFAWPKWSFAGRAAPGPHSLHFHASRMNNKN